jgi:hypothetical protein
VAAKYPQTTESRKFSKQALLQVKAQFLIFRYGWSSAEVSLIAAADAY